MKVCVARAGRLLASGVEIPLVPGVGLWLRGANGAGKTTLLEVLAGLLPGAEEPLTPTPCYIPLVPLAWQHLSWMRLRRHWRALYGRKGILDTAWQALLPKNVDNIPLEHLSAGQRQRFALAELAFAGARVWLLDEPFACLDTGGIDILEKLLARHLASGGSAVVAGHQAWVGATAILDADAWVRPVVVMEGW